MDKLRIFIDYPVSETGQFLGLAVQQLLHDHLKTRSDVEVVRDDQDFDIILVANGDSHYVGRNPPGSWGSAALTRSSRWSERAGGWL
ncbi:hypothetical protein D9623_34100 (plasmid) [Azospirillum brasilense]|nr:MULTISPECIES: hypothetical protein [Azospirillum]ALJ39493.1 hypothetical protein AMK58_28730 [Azospirillum brasilense]ALJ39591.1 hypothetical protein AMK58_29265 [Azospirillum brasilense]MDW7555768.1 hypothetical protein [Azospirillum brasilense]MDW7595796.1 hypothetical protein [Azospirillum brasilense]MDW7630801.1 hypothetical protein [Azospirillum brasilense]